MLPETESKVVLEYLLVPVPDGANEDDDEDEQLQALTSFTGQFFQNCTHEPGPDDVLPQPGVQEDSEDGCEEEDEREDRESHSHCRVVVMVIKSQTGDGDDESDQGEQELEGLVDPAIPVNSQEQEVRQHHHVVHHGQDVQGLVLLVSRVGFLDEEIEGDPESEPQEDEKLQHDE